MTIEEMTMAIIKPHSDLEQSKKLAEILPLESADMYYEEVCNLPKAIVGNYILHNQCMEDKDYKKLSNPVLSPTWSLAALLDILPDRTCVFKKTYKDGRVKYQGVMEGNKELILKNNPVDACVVMIEKLNEENLL